MTPLHRITGCVLLLTTLAVVPTTLTAAEQPAARAARIRTDGVNFLRTTQAEDGSWTAPKAVGISALITTALLESGLSADDPTVAKALAFLEKHVQKDGGIYVTGSRHRNYETCICMMAFRAAGREKKYSPVLKRAEKFLRGLQWDEGEGLESTDTAFGGAGYGSHERPDMSNTQFLMEALKAAGAGPDDPALKKALVFVSRSQNLESEHNPTEFSAKINDGGFYYTPAAGGTSQAGKTEAGGLRSYGSMTYAGLKSMIYAGLTAEDPRVQAATKWIRQHYSLTENPGLGQMGLYYYYQTFAKALTVMELDELEDADGTRHNWRTELIDQLAKLQQSNGSWVNSAPRWYEGDPNLSTAYALLALSSAAPVEQ